MVRAIIILALFALASAAAAAGGKGQGLTPVDGKPAAPDFALKDMDGRTYRLSDLDGQVVIINFWATWCPPCREEMPSMQRAWEALKDDGVEMLAINVGESAETIFRFTADYPVEFPLLLDEDSSTAGDWPVKGLPTTYVVDPEGRLVYQAIGGREWDDPELLEPIRALARGRVAQN